ncbi:hypothetical protein ABZ923_38665 [Streptomyces sp. NPDC046881]|uniref:hypothetical protein n=1 Tax=Streptomyces sp. NPDC046881 TaxID=3155374 RepID=UPI0033E1E8DF
MDEWAPDIPQTVRSELPPFGIKPHWVTFGFSTPANRLYDLYNAHVDRSRADLVVWPTLDDLAKMMGLSRGDKVTPYMRELEAGGAVSVQTVTKTGGKGRRYIITLKVHPPAGFTGPLQTSDWYDTHRASQPGKTTMADRARNGRTEEPVSGEVPPPEGVYVGPQDGDDVHPPQGGVTKNQSNQNQKKTAPAARSAGDARRASTGSSAGAAQGGSAATEKRAPSRKKTRLSPVETALVAVVERAVPPSLLELLSGQKVPHCWRVSVLRELEHRTAEQLADRVARRWVRHRYQSHLLAGRGIDNPYKVLQALVRAGECPDAGCEDGELIDTGADCRTCQERKARRGPGGSVPTQRTGGRAWWECRTCRNPKPVRRESEPEDRVCQDCNREAALVCEALAARWNTPVTEDVNDR